MIVLIELYLHVRTIFSDLDLILRSQWHETVEMECWYFSVSSHPIKFKLCKMVKIRSRPYICY